jgi:SAM-dependent methyltransferase
MNDWQRFFDGFAERYDKEVFTQNTDAEVRFMIEHLRPPAGSRILDLGCGTGRHSVALAASGYDVTGVDLSRGMLDVAARRAADAGVTVSFEQQDAAQLDLAGRFDLAICLCEGAMCLLTDDDDPLERDMRILANVFASLKPGGRFLLNVLNACRQIRLYSDADVASGRFDVLNLTEASDAPMIVSNDASTFKLRERGYTPPEIKRMLRATGFIDVRVYGGTAGAWQLAAPKLDEMELMLFANKPPTPAG